MLLVSQAGVGDMLPTRAMAGNLNFTAYTVSLADGSTNIGLVNKDVTNGVNASVDTGVPVSAATGVRIRGRRSCAVNEREGFGPLATFDA